MIPDPEMLVDLYRDMWLIRAFEFGLEREFKKGNVPGMLHTGVGQEATQAALAAHLQATDCFFPDHRCHGINALARGEVCRATGERIMASCLAVPPACAAARAAACTAPTPRSATLATTPWKARTWLTVLGVALAYKMRKEPKVACCIIGDGTVGRGEFHESLNLAAIWQLPVLYACVNNGYAISTPVGKGHASADIVDHGARLRPALRAGRRQRYRGWPMPKLQKAVEYIRAGKGPYFLEFKTWRWQGIFSGEFRPADEVKYWKEERDPIKLARVQIVEQAHALTAADLDRIEAEVKGGDRRLDRLCQAAAPCRIRPRRRRMCMLGGKLTELRQMS